MDETEVNNIGKIRLIPDSLEIAQQLLDYMHRNELPSFIVSTSIPEVAVREYIEGKRDSLLTLRLQFSPKEEK